MKKSIQKLGAVAFSMVLAVLALIPANAFAALTAAQQAVVDAVDAQIADYTTMAWGILLLVMGGLVGIKLFKKFFHKAV